ncbi:MAG: arsenate reductase ArsC [Candidatus Omnitrophica bacterium]|nr:arsenate reductase ArsC [Candidatus Omnitrophota bacterium]MCM8791101.1 arsenate reductase ArsC [Candidatus Omnitrophota bacterium]
MARQDKKKILFVCTENSCRSQMAEGFAKSFGKDIFEAYSAGSKPSGRVDPMAIEVMREVGIDISDYRSKGFDELGVKKFDTVITLGCGDVCPFVPADEHLAWEIDDPKGRDIEFFREVRSKIRYKVKNLAESILRSEGRKRR